MLVLPQRMSVVLTIACFACVISFTLAVVPVSQWNRCSPLHTNLKSFSGISLDMCAKKCGKRPNCYSFNYLTTSKMCHLLYAASLPTDDDMTTQRACVNVRRSDIPAENVCDVVDGNCIVKVCPIPEVANADIKGNILTFGSRIKVECHTGYRTNIDLPIICGEDGSWTNIPTCINKCTDPPKIENAELSAGDNSVGEIRTYTCKPGAVSQPADVTGTAIKCQKTCTWTSTNLQCLIDCGEPYKLDNAALIEEQGSTFESSERYYKCNPGFSTPHNTTYVTRTCQEDGEWTRSSTTCSINTAGLTGATSFVFSFVHNFKSPNDAKIYVLSSHSTDVEVTSPSPLIPFHEDSADSGPEITMLSDGVDLVPNDTETVQYGLHLKSDGPVGVYVENVDQWTTGGTVVFPEEHLSNEYILLSWSNHTKYKAVFAVVATVKDTRVKIHFAQGEPRSTELSLNRFDVYHHKTLNDISGTHVSSTHNVAVFAGHECTFIDAGRCDHLTEQMPPISDLQREYIVSYSYPRHDYLIRIIAVEDGTTEISLSNGTSLTLHRTEHTQYLINGIPIAINATHKIMIAAYTRGGQTRPEGLKNVYDGSMLIVPGLSQFKSEYNMFVPENVSESVLMITYPVYESDTNNIRLNNNHLDVRESASVTMVGRGKYTILYIEIPEGKSFIYTVDGTPFGAYLSLRRQGAESWFSLPYKL